MRRVCTPPHGLGEGIQEPVPHKKANRNAVVPLDVVTSPPPAQAEGQEHSSPSSVMLSCSSNDADLFCFPHRNGDAAPTSPPSQPPLTQERLLALQQSASDRNLVALAPATTTALNTSERRTGTTVLGATHLGGDTDQVIRQRQERVMSWLAGSSTTPNPPLDNADDGAIDAALRGSGVPDGSHTPPRLVVASVLAPDVASAEPLLPSYAGSAGVVLRSPTCIERSSHSAVVPVWCAHDTRAQACYSAAERVEEGDDKTSSAARSAPLRQTRLLESSRSCSGACCTPPRSSPHPWSPSALHTCDAQGAPVTASDWPTVSIARDSPRHTPTPLASVLLPFPTSPTPRRLSVVCESTKDCFAPSPALSGALRDARNRVARREPPLALSVQEAVTAASAPRATSSHGDGEDPTALRVCTLSGRTLRVTADRRSSVAVLAQRVVQYLKLRGAQVQLKYAQTGLVFDAGTSDISGVETSSATANMRLCDLPEFQSSDVFIVLLRAQRGEPSPLALLPPRLSAAGWLAGRSPSPRPSSAPFPVRLSRRLQCACLAVMPPQRNAHAKARWRRRCRPSPSQSHRPLWSVGIELVVYVALLLCRR
ncbi:hypothetical protein LDHU3_10.0620:CDS1 [Leishmania donovani]|uniref:Hypothetical_protein n=1 Tax=Leishmania donovani TaxID=5661 RepID=A0A6J8F945_LEIDO|nr:hypothetical protein LDHU3_10.0620:CDS1 [Leishmania donovani]VDZ42614.1 hypothetical_protein [Leishmania donovani]